jgi:hypothetical protein
MVWIAPPSRVRGFIASGVVFVALALTSCGGSSPDSSALLAPSKAPLSDFSQEITVSGIPPKMTPKQQYRLTGISVKNIGQQTWQAEGPNPVQLTYSWLTPEGKLVSHGDATPTPADIGPGKSQSLDATIVAPQEPGRYILSLTMIAQNLAWFSDVGGKPSNFPVTVVPQ